MASKIQIKRGLKANLPILGEGEPAFTTDTKEFFVGDGSDNIEFAKQEDLNKSSAQLSENTQNIAQLSNPNLLINGDFQVWQRGTSFSNLYQQYSADRWYCMRSGTGITTVTKADDGMSITTTEIFFMDQFVENSDKYKDAIMTASIVIDDILYTITGKPSENKNLSIPKGVFKLYFNASKNMVVYSLQLNNSAVIKNKCKLEFESKATPFVPRLYAEELALCQRYYQVFPINSLRVNCIIPDVNTLYLNSILLGIPMRSNPTVSVNCFSVYSGYIKQTDFTFDKLINSNKVLSIRAQKNAHGLSGNNIQIINESDLTLDSEIY